jgi:hypothetical protein
VLLSDAELKRWWEQKTKTDRLSLLELIQERAQSSTLRDRAGALFKEVVNNITPTAADLAVLKKWDN